MLLAAANLINTAADAARALEPLVKTFPHSGQIAQGLFALGIVSLGMLAITFLGMAAAVLAMICPTYTHDHQDGTP